MEVYTNNRYKISVAILSKIGDFTAADIVDEVLPIVDSQMTRDKLEFKVEARL